MTAHGIGMVGIAGFGGAAIMWYFLAQWVALTTAVLAINLILFLIGVVLILGAVFLGGFAAAWTFLYPLPALSGGVWSATSSTIYLIGVLLVGVGFLLLHLETGRAILARYGGLGRAPRLAADDGHQQRRGAAAGRGRLDHGVDHQHLGLGFRGGDPGDDHRQHPLAGLRPRSAARQEHDLLFRAYLHQRHHLHGRDRHLRNPAPVHGTGHGRRAARS